MIPSPSTQIRPANMPSFTGVCWSRRARSKETGVLALACLFNSRNNRKVEICSDL